MRGRSETLLKPGLCPEGVVPCFTSCRLCCLPGPCGCVQGACLWAQMTLTPMASVMAATEPKWVSVWGRFLWAMLLSMVLGSLLALLLPLGTVEEHCLTVLKGFYLLRSKLERAQPGITKCTRPSTELSLTSRGAALLGIKTKASPGKTGHLSSTIVDPTGVQRACCVLCAGHVVALSSQQHKVIGGQDRGGAVEQREPREHTRKAP